jgi:hypothetical protein
MRAKVQSVDSAALGAVVAATSASRISIAVAAALTLGALWSCAVDLSATTPGAAAVCNPTAQELTDANLAMSNSLQNTTAVGAKENCGSCHIGSPDEQGSAQFGILTTTDATSKRLNWCAAAEHAKQIASKFMQTTHPGGPYSPSEFQDLYDWARTLAQ